MKKEKIDSQLEQWEKYKPIGESDKYIEYQRTRRTNIGLIDEYVKIPKEFIEQQKLSIIKEIEDKIEEFGKDISSEKNPRWVKNKILKIINQLKKKL